MPGGITPLPATVTAPNSSGIVGEVPPDLMAKIKDDMAQRLGIRSDTIVELTGEFVEWSDGSLGCPEPGVVYTQAQVKGYHVVLQAGNTVYDYRATTRGAFRLCANPTKQ